MQKDQETIEGLLYCLDDIISSRDRRYKTLDEHYKNKNGHVLNRDYSEYSKRKEFITRRFNSDALEYQEKLDRLCHRIRNSQPSLLELSKKHNIKTKT